MQSFEPITDGRPDDRPWPDMVWPADPDVRLAGSHVELTPLTTPPGASSGRRRTSTSR